MTTAISGGPRRLAARPGSVQRRQEGGAPLGGVHGVHRHAVEPLQRRGVQHLGGRPRDLNHSVPQQQHAVGHAQRLVRVVGGEQHGHAGGGQPPQLAQHAALVAEVQAGGGFVEHDDACVLGQRAGDQRQLALAAGNLQKRLLSSVEAFVRTLKVHRTSVEKQVIKQTGLTLERLSLLQNSPISDDDRADLSEFEVEYEEETQMAIATQQTTGAITPAEISLLDQMVRLATAHRYEPDARVKALAQWIKVNLCPDLGQPNAQWLDRRVLIFTEYTDTKRYLEQQLGEIIAGSDRAEERIGVFQGGMDDEKRELIKNAFNTDPAKHPLRILIATDAAREGVNLQNYCADLFHFDVPWNPSRMEQRNGRIDRKLQRAKVVRCHYFFLAQRAEDRVLEVLVEKTRRIQEELGSLTPVVEKNINKLFEQGISRREGDRLCQALEKVNQDSHQHLNIQAVEEELESIRPESKKLAKNIEELQKLLQQSKEWLGLEDRHFREALSVSLEMQGIDPLHPLDAAEVAQNPETARWEIPALDQVKGADPTWLNTLDTLRRPRTKGQKPWEWRKECPVRPVVFRDPGSLDGDVVHLHLEHRIVQRLLSKFLSQGFLHHELSRACVCLTDNPIPKVIALGRLSLYGVGAARLHDEIVAIAADWIPPESRGRRKLKVLTEQEKDEVLALLEMSLGNHRLEAVSETVKERLIKTVPLDIEELKTSLEQRAEILTERAKRKLTDRGEKEAIAMVEILRSQRQRILDNYESAQFRQMELDLDIGEEKRQLESDRRHWEKRLAGLEQEMVTEPERIREVYQVKAQRIEPVGLVYLYPVSG